MTLQDAVEAGWVLSPRLFTSSSLNRLPLCFIQKLLSLEVHQSRFKPHFAARWNNFELLLFLLRLGEKFKPNTALIESFWSFSLSEYWDERVPLWLVRTQGAKYTPEVISAIIRRSPGQLSSQAELLKWLVKHVSIENLSSARLIQWYAVELWAVPYHWSRSCLDSYRARRWFDPVRTLSEITSRVIGLIDLVRHPDFITVLRPGEQFRIQMAVQIKSDRHTQGQGKSSLA